ncbi:restriction endonuclease subunit S [Dehalococcoides sp. UCH007]|uniref:restriction endonuclease subunit S n=1 Tax=Dehalococcoides sp. UCH007 TaxID=1522671 RepID=UPI0005B565BE|nr:restriction endonuclease subunit S [Dehalococcoides sp. UCH007]OPX92544.1 MAG: EcoKI restriction-modification system protein HsdS [Pelotomaculum sp. PtaB.Bin104]BAQ34149.1 type I restriction-modification system specificity subunit [Dehalococcoides sp. UCH007]
MEIKAGYKQTEIGGIPSDWDVKALGEIGEPTIGLTYKPEDVREYGLLVLRSSNIGDNGLKFDDNVFVDVKVQDKLYTKPGDILVCVRNGSRPLIGKSALIDEDSAGYTFGAFMSVYRTDDSSFIFHLFNSNIIKRQIQRNIGATINQITNKDIRSFLVPFPITKDERIAIAEALSDADDLIANTEKLIAKKKDLKQGAMQLLLSGKKRLAGFSGEWETKTIGDIFSISGGISASRDKLSDEGYCYLHYGDIHGSNKSYIDVGEEYLKIPKLKVNIKSINPKSLLNDGDVVFVDASEDDEGASKHLVIKNQNKIPYISGLHTIVLKSKDDSLVNLYKRYCFKTNNVKRQFKFYAVGTKVTGISKTNIANVQLLLPPTKEEQSLVAQALSDLDNEIEGLEGKIAKYKLIKQGMAQELLTGKKRLV